MKRPFTYMLLPLMGGIIFSYYIELNIRPILIILFLSMITYLTLFLKNREKAGLLFFLFFLTGIILNLYHLNDSILIENTGQAWTVNGVVEEILKDEEEEARYILRVDSLEDPSLIIRLREKAILKIIGPRDIRLGSRISFKGSFNIPAENTNPMLYNYRLNLLTSKIYTTSTIKDYSIIEINNQDINRRYRIKTSFIENVETVFDNNLKARNSSTVKSIILGQYAYLEEEDIEKYRDLGLAHILAVSGLHIGIIGGFVIYILSRVGVKRVYNILITLCIIWFYGFLIGFPASLLRANLMMSILFISQIRAEAYDPINSLSIAGLVLLVINPLWIFNLGFQLSFGAALSLFTIVPRLVDLCYPYRNKLTYSLAATSGVQLGLLPLQAYYFNKISLISVFSNILIAPLLSLALVMAGLMLGISYIFPLLNFPLGKILDIILDIQGFFLNLLYGFSWGNIKIYSPNILEFLLYYLGLATAIRMINLQGLDRKLNKILLYYLSLTISLNLFLVFKDQSLEIDFIDVGQGDSILLRSKSYNYLIDTGGNVLGNFDIGKNITYPYLTKLGVTSLDGLFISHFDEDHCKSLPLLMDNIKIRNSFISYEDKGQIYKIMEEGLQPRILNQGDLIRLDKNISLEVISPNEDMRTRRSSPNNLSLVFILSYFDKKILFTGDMEKETEEEIIEKIKGSIDIIKVPHHGSDTSSTRQLLEKIKPKLGVISVGRNNLYGHPREEIVNRYLELGTDLYRTDLHGRVKLILNKNDLLVESFIKERRTAKELLDDNYYMILFYCLYYLLFYMLLKIYKDVEMEMTVDELQRIY